MANRLTVVPENSGYKGQFRASRRPIHSDICELFNPISVNGEVYFLTFNYYIYILNYIINLIWCICFERTVKCLSFSYSMGHM